MSKKRYAFDASVRSYCREMVRMAVHVIDEACRPVVYAKGRLSCPSLKRRFVVNRSDFIAAARRLSYLHESLKDVAEVMK